MKRVCLEELYQIIINLFPPPLPPPHYHNVM